MFLLNGLNATPMVLNVQALTALTQPGITQTPVTPGTVVTATPVASSWYTTWWGLGLIGLGGFLAYKKFKAKKPA
jgi:LPXTG-motif cell wall-anchored protein